MMAALIQKCQEVSDDLWPRAESESEASNWRTGFDGLENMYVYDLVFPYVAIYMPIPSVRFY